MVADAMKWCVALVLVGVCGAQDPPESELAQLRERVTQLEARLEEQRQAQEEVNGLLLRALDAMTERLEGFLRAVQEGALQPGAGPGEAAEPGEAGEPEETAQAEPAEDEGWTTALGVTGLALGFAFLAWLWNLRSVSVADAIADVGPSIAEAGADPGAGVGPVSVADAGAGVVKDAPVKERVVVAPEPVMAVEVDAPVVEPVPAEGNGEGELDVENVGVGELGLANVLPVELEEAREGGRRDEAPCRVQWKLRCANPAVGEQLVRDLLVREPRVLAEPAPRVEAQGHSLRIGYHVHPRLPAADRTQIAGRLTEVLEGIPPASSLRGGPV